ncbi:MAG: intracellular growth attenuator family protein [Yersiniaceae bacterium]|uniref:Intracellular growth attenuator protein igaA n=1 Tax=Chimaeribacter coloradensis TaxID=2060068 RepID=A0A2N5E6R4_9GAMM|nr:intracellular growth attenuator family protein [Chimaeribacter coloradensis]MDU6410192.1 intracellular growth attenuator family protein [Yersiniaceae bacterium]PLR37004.1 Intracellular growth attenuator protein igaA [Chimaeribacter coloradensis]
MSTIAVILAVLFAMLIIIGGYLRGMLRHRTPFASSLPFMKPTHRKLTPEERQAVERYLRQSDRLSLSSLSASNNIFSLRDKLTLTPKSDTVYSLTKAITRYGVASDEPNKWRYYLDTEEVHLPPFWEPYITQDNQVEIIRTQTIPLVISLNGHSLLNHVYDRRPAAAPVVAAPSQNASIRKEESDHIELLTIRRETPEEHALYQTSGVREAFALSGAMVLLFFSLTSPMVFLPWLILLAVILSAWAGWRLLRRPQERDLQEIHCLRGAPKRWGLFGESNQGNISNISLGIIDLIYPAHWQPYVSRDLGQVTDVDIYLNRQVVRQGHYLSLHDEVKHFPLQRWAKSLVLMCGSLLVLLMLTSYISLSLPLKLSLAWIQGATSTQVTSVQALENTPLRIGDTLRAQGNGMCYIPPNYQNNKHYAFMPFDCAGIYWNNATPLPLPESVTIEKASALLAAVNNQLHPTGGADQNINPQLATAIEKSGMILLDNFTDIVLKTQDLCSNDEDCVRLKNALVNLGNAQNWSALVKRAQSGSMRGMNVLLRPVSAESLDNLVNSATSSFFFHETHRAAEALNSPPPGGFLITSDEGKQLVNHAPPALSLYDYNAQEQWHELQRLSAMLLHTPFRAEGIITNITIDANGTRHISLHSEPDMITLWRYMGTSLLLLLVTVSFIVNAVLLVKRLRRHQRRISDIQHYYDHCFNPSLSPMPLRPFN